MRCKRYSRSRYEPNTRNILGVYNRITKSIEIWNRKHAHTYKVHFFQSFLESIARRRHTPRRTSVPETAPKCGCSGAREAGKNPSAREFLDRGRQDEAVCRTSHTTGQLLQELQNRYLKYKILEYISCYKTSTSHLSIPVHLITSQSNFILTRIKVCALKNPGSKAAQTSLDFVLYSEIVCF